MDRLIISKGRSEFHDVNHMPHVLLVLSHQSGSSLGVEPKTLTKLPTSGLSWRNVELGKGLGSTLAEDVSHTMAICDSIT